MRVSTRRVPIRIAPMPGGDFEESISEREGAEDEAHLHLRQGQIAHDVVRRNRDANAVQICNCRKSAAERQDFVSYACTDRD